MKQIKTAAAIVAAIAIAASTASVGAEVEKKSEASQVELERQLEAAQERLDSAAREVADLSMSLSEHVVPHVRSRVSARLQRGMLGINVASDRSSDRDEGVEIVSVSPGGAAADAGLKAGDVLIEVKGKALKREGDSSPHEQLMAAMREVKPEEKVSVSYRRDGKVSAVTIVAQSLADRMFTGALPFDGGHGEFGYMPHFAFMRADGVFGSAELVPLTPKLGQYFGADKGLLVVRSPADSRLKLEDGDVILDIDGRTPSNPSHALRILGSYQAGEKLKLNVLRAKKRISFDITIPEDTWEKRRDGAHFTHPDRVMSAPMPGVRVPAPVPPAPAVPVVKPLSDELV